MAAVEVVKALEPPRNLARLPTGFREQPHNTDAEQALLGAILLDNRVYRDVAAYLRPEHFYEPVHGRIYAAITREIRAGHLADWVMLRREFDDDEALRELDGAQYLARIARTSELIIDAGNYGQLLHDLAVKRGLIHVGEELVNRAYDAREPARAEEQIANARELFQTLSRELAPIIKLPEIDLDVVAEGQFSDQEWAIDQIVPVGTAGLIGGPQSAGKTFLELLRMICLVTGKDFLGHAVRPIEAAHGYFSEDSKGWLERYVAKICRALSIDPRELKGRLRVVSTFGSHRVLFRAERDATEVVSTAWFEEIRDDALAVGAKWIALDHLLRYCAIAHTSPQQAFSMFEQLDALATDLGGNVVVLTHPSKGDIKAGVKGMIQIGGSSGLVQAPRWVQTLRRLDDEDGRKVRQFTVEKVSYGERQRFAIRLVENDRGIVEHAGEMDPDDDGSGTLSSRGRPSKAEATFGALLGLYLTHRRAITLEELVSEVIRLGIVNEAAANTRAWIDRRKTVRSHIAALRDRVDDRGGSYAVKPEALP